MQAKALAAPRAGVSAVQAAEARCFTHEGDNDLAILLKVNSRWRRKRAADPRRQGRSLNILRTNCAADPSGGWLRVESAGGSPPRGTAGSMPERRWCRCPAPTGIRCASQHAEHRAANAFVQRKPRTVSSVRKRGKPDYPLRFGPAKPYGLCVR